MQHEIKERHNLLNEFGLFIEAGYSKETMLRFNKENLKTKKYRLKTWDYFLIGNKDYAISLTLAHNGYMAVCGIQVFDFLKKEKYDYSKFIFKNKDRIKMPNKSFEGFVSYQDTELKLNFDYTNNQVDIKGSAKEFNALDDLKVDIKLESINKDFMSIAIPFKKTKKCFYFNEKFNHLLAKGCFTRGEESFTLDNMYGVLDWGRGVWPYDNTWYWSSASGKTIDNILIGFNFGYGFGDTSKASENIFYYDEKGYKFDDILFDIPKDFLSVWKIYNESKSINLVFEPLFDNKTKINYIILGQDAHQVFGIFKGSVLLEDKLVEVNDLFGFAEKVRNRW